MYWNKASGNCYSTGGNYTTCDFSTTGLTSSAKAMIDNHTWNLGSHADFDINTSGIGTARQSYEYERSSNSCKICRGTGNICDSVERTTTWAGYVGLMYPSDFGYAVGGDVRTNCLANTNLYQYHTNNCYTNDWLFDGDNYQWTMSPYAISSHASLVFGVDSDGSLGDAFAYYVSSARPALFLKSSVERTGGNGTPTNPYTISLP